VYLSFQKQAEWSVLWPRAIFVLGLIRGMALINQLKETEVILWIVNKQDAQKAVVFYSI